MVDSGWAMFIHKTWMRQTVHRRRRLCWKCGFRPNLCRNPRKVDFAGNERDIHNNTGLSVPTPKASLNRYGWWWRRRRTLCFMAAKCWMARIMFYVICMKVLASLLWIEWQVVFIILFSFFFSFTMKRAKIVTAMFRFDLNTTWCHCLSFTAAI